MATDFSNETIFVDGIGRKTEHRYYPNPHTAS
jgi:hypothetical protein